MIRTDFSNWIIYVTVKHRGQRNKNGYYFSNWIIYVTVKPGKAFISDITILVTE